MKEKINLLKYFFYLNKVIDISWIPASIKEQSEKQNKNKQTTKNLDKMLYNWNWQRTEDPLNFNIIKEMS